MKIRESIIYIEVIKTVDPLFKIAEISSLKKICAPEAATVCKSREHTDQIHIIIFKMFHFFVLFFYPNNNNHRTRQGPTHTLQQACCCIYSLVTEVKTIIVSP